MKLPIIQSLWIGKPLSNLEKLCIQSFMDNGHEFHLYTYDSVGEIPAGCIVKDGNAILPATDIFISKSGTVGGFSDWFRYALLYKKGGWWVDMDMICIKPFDFGDDIVLSDAIFNDGTRQFQNNPLKFPAKHPLMQEMEKHCRELPNKDRAVDIATGGPPTLSAHIRRHGLENRAKPIFHFHFMRSQITVLDDSFRDGLLFHPQTYALHFGNSMFEYWAIDKNAQYDSQSAFEQLKVKHGIANLPTASKKPHAVITTDFESAIAEAAAKRRRKNKHRSRRERLSHILLVLALVIVGILLLGGS